MQALWHNRPDWVRWTAASLPTMTLVAALLATQRHALGLVHGEPTPFSDSLLWYAFQWGPWMTLAPLIFWQLFRWPLRGAHGHRIFSFHVPRVALTGLLVVAMHTAIQASLKVLFFEDFAEQSFVAALRYLFLAKAHAEYLVYLVIAGLVYGTRLAQHYRAERDRTAELNRLYDRHRLQSLRQQLAPHFLFNALNSLCAMLEEDSAPHRMTIAIGQFLREVVDQRDPMTTLADEVQILRSYLTIQQMRFGDRLSFEISIQPDCLTCPLPTLALQPLVENAIVHGTARLTDAACIAIEARRSGDSCVITIQNDAPIPKLAHHVVRPGRGLSLLGELLDQTYSNRARLETAWTRPDRFKAKLTLPLDGKATDVSLAEDHSRKRLAG